MKAPENTQVYKTPLATLWQDEKGILNWLSNETTRTISLLEDTYAMVNLITGAEKVPMLVDATLSKPMDKPVREYTEVELPKLFRAIAVFSNSALGEVTTMMFLKLNEAIVPVKFFSNEKDAKEWLNQYV